MLAGVKVVDKSVAEAALRDEHRASRKEKKAHKKERSAAKKEARRQGEIKPSSQRTSSSQAADDSIMVHMPVTPAPPDLETCEREAWMTTPMARPPDPARAAGPTAGGSRGESEKALEAQEKAAIAVARELNPDYQGKGDSTLPAGTAATVVARPAGVGDGGSSWRLKALRRAQAQAAQQGVSLTDIVSERWGNVANLTAGITEQRAAHAKAHMAAARERRSGPSCAARGDEDPDTSSGLDGSRAGSTGYLRDVRSERSQMRRPAAGSGFSSRKPDRANSGHNSGQGHGSGSGAEGRPHTDTTPVSRGSRDRGNSRGGHDGTTQSQQATRLNTGSRQAAALQDAAPSINTFANDGSFMTQSQQHAEKSDRRPSDDEVSPGQGSEESPSPNIEAARVEAQAAAEHARTSAAEHGVRQSDASAPAAAASAEAAREALAGNAREQATSRKAAAPAVSGNLSVAAALRARLMGGKAAAASPAAVDTSVAPRPKREVDILPSVDASGRAVAGAFGREDAHEGARPPGRKEKKLQRYDASGKRERWTADDDGTDLATLVKRQRHEGAEDMDAALANNIARRARFKENDLNADDEYDFDTGIDMYQRRKGNQEQQKKRQRSAAIADSRRLTAALKGCHLCITSPLRPKHLTLAIGEASYLMLPPKGTLADGHCYIVPAEHVASARRCDDVVATEIRNFKKALLQMFMAKDMDVVFMETAVRLDDARTHALIEAVPLPSQAFSRAPLYFKKAVDDAESEWSQHHAKRLIDTRAKGLSGCIPPNFPYFHVEFNLTSGFVHVIDDEAGWDPAFGRSVLAGLLGLPPNTGLAHQKAEPEALQKQRAAAFLRDFRDYDWTEQL